jgi:hypothetical protein
LIPGRPSCRRTRRVLDGINGIYRIRSSGSNYLAVSAAAFSGTDTERSSSSNPVNLLSSPKS